MSVLLSFTLSFNGMLGGYFTILYAVLAFCIVPGAAQATRAFKWGFNLPDIYPYSFQECQDVPLVILPLADRPAFGVPPYYMLAFEPGGIPTTIAVGSDDSNLLWKANHKRGTVLMLTVVDSKNQTGGIPRTQFVMEASVSSTSCLPAAPEDVPVITPNVTDSLTTCQPWGLKVTGGKKPYTIALTAFNSTTMTNSTMGPTDDTYVYINRADPESPLMASVADANGRWGKSTLLVPTTGSTNTTCPGLRSTSFDSSGSNNRSETARTTHAKNTKVTLIAGLVSGLLFVATVGAFAWLWNRRRRNREDSSDDGQIFPGVWEEPNAQVPVMDQAEWSPASLIPGGISQGSSLQRVRIVQHHDAEVVHELPPPYAEGAAHPSQPSRESLASEKVPEVTALRPDVVG